MKNKYFGYLEKITHRGIQSTIMLTFSVISISLMLILGLVLEARFSAVYRDEVIRSTRMLICLLYTSDAADE